MAQFKTDKKSFNDILSDAFNNANRVKLYKTKVITCGIVVIEIENLHFERYLKYNGVGRNFRGKYVIDVSNNCPYDIQLLEEVGKAMVFSFHRDGIACKLHVISDMK